MMGIKSVVTVGFTMAMAWALVACPGWGKAACTAVDIAEGACTVIRYMDDGGQQQVQLDRDDLRALSAKKAADRADAGK
jgi:hypothetical protein